MFSGILNTPLMSSSLQFTLLLLMLYNGQTQAQIPRDRTTSIPETLLLERTQTWKLVNCTNESEDYLSPQSQMVNEDYLKDKNRNWKRTNTSGRKESVQDETERLSQYDHGTKRPTLIEALTNGYKRQLKIFWALFSQLSAISNSPNEDELDERRKCSPRGTTYDSHISLCPICRVRTKLPEGHIPPYIDEVICEKDNMPCFRKNGKCFQRYMKITALRKIPGSHCLLADQNGHQFWTGNWEIYDQNVRVSCECLLDKRSKFVKYALS